MARNAIMDNDLDNVTGGKITYTWDGSTGTIGINNNNAFVLLDKNAFVSYYNSVKGTGIKESEILKNLLAKGIIRK